MTANTQSLRSNNSHRRSYTLGIAIMDILIVKGQDFFDSVNKVDGLPELKTPGKGCSNLCGSSHQSQVVSKGTHHYI